MRLGRIAVAVVELRDVASAEQAAESLKAAGPLRDRCGEDSLAGFAEVGALGDEAEPVEVHVRTAENGDEVAPRNLLPLDVALRTCNAQRS